MTKQYAWSVAAAALLIGVAACSEAPAREDTTVTPAIDSSLQVVVRDTIIDDVIEAPARTEALQATTLSTKLMAQVVAVRAREGDRVSSGTVLLELDARDLIARREQADASLRSAEAAHHEAELQAVRMRALFADSAAPRAQVDAAEAGLARASQGVRGARAGIAELETLIEQATVRAPFAGVVVQRFVDEGALVAPGLPLMRIENASQLRVIASVPPSNAAALSRGKTVDVEIEGVAAHGRVEGIVPSPGAALVLIQVLVDNPGARFSSGSSAVVAVPAGRRHAKLVPAAALVAAGDLIGVRVRSGGGVVTRWIRVGRRYGALVEVLSGITLGDTVVMPVDPARN